MVLLGRQLPDWRVHPAGGGQTVWAELPDPLCSRLVVAAAAEGLIITPGHRFFAAGGGERHLRLPFTAPIRGAHRGGHPAVPGLGADRRHLGAPTRAPSRTT